MNVRRPNLPLALLVLLVLTAGGTAGYTLIEGWPLFDSLYMTVTTLATVGYGEVHPLALKRGTKVTLSPQSDTVLESGDQLAVIGTPAQLKALERGAS